MEKVLNTQEASDYLANLGIPITPGTLEVWRCHGKGPRFRRISRMVRYAPKDLDRWCEGQIVETVDSVN